MKANRCMWRNSRCLLGTQFLAKQCKAGSSLSECTSVHHLVRISMRLIKMATLLSTNLKKLLMMLSLTETSTWDRLKNTTWCFFHQSSSTYQVGITISKNLSTLISWEVSWFASAAFLASWLRKTSDHPKTQLKLQLLLIAWLTFLSRRGWNFQSRLRATPNFTFTVMSRWLQLSGSTKLCEWVSFMGWLI